MTARICIDLIKVNITAFFAVSCKKTAKKGYGVKKIFFTALAAISLATPAVAADDVFQSGDWMVRVRALGVLPDVSSSLSPIGGTVKINNTAVPEIDFTRFFTSNISAELIAAVTPHNLRVKSGSATGTDAGRAWLLPPTLTLQYHITQLCPYVIPYVGAGVNYTHFYDTTAGALGTVKYDDSFGGALQAGVDIPIKNNWYANLDVKKVYVSTKATFAPSGIRAKVDIDPWLVGVGIGYKF